MLKLKRYNEAPQGGFSVIYKKSGFQDFKAHGWSINAVASQLYQEQLRRGERCSLEQAKSLVEQHTCNELMKTDHWEEWVSIESEWKYEDYAPLDGYDRETTSPSSQGTLFSVVFPFCAKDGQLALKLMKWIGEITPHTDHPLILSYDTQTPPQTVQEVANAAKTTFRSIKAHSYTSPPHGTWPPTWAFKSAARFMEIIGTPWLWMEPDAVPLKPEWLDVLQDIYWKCGKAFAGPVVPLMGHMNGTGIYPANTTKRIPMALDRMRTAWDVSMKSEMISDCHDLTPIFYHAWTMINGEFHAFSGGAVPSFPSGSHLHSKIPKESVIFHRNKDLTLIDRIKENVKSLLPAR